MDFFRLRQKHKQLFYQGFQISHLNKDLKISFDFILDPDIKFTPYIVFPNIDEQRLKEMGQETLNNLAFNLGMVELLSYWKAACPPQIVIKAGYLDEDQIKLWKKLLIKGMGEFFYNNKIDFTQKDLVSFVILSKAKDITESYSSPASPVQNDRNNNELKDRNLVLVGGGKDSAVTLEMISKSKRESKSLLLNPTTAALELTRAAEVEPIIVKRTIDPKLLELNEKGYLNGHTPFSAYLAFLSVFTGVLYDYKNLVVSNEASSNEGNVTWLGEEINHQYSKSSEFEKDFRSYCSKYLSTSSNYYSFLRPFGELQISEKFSKMEKYHKIFRSCNRGSKQGVWCGECPKCVSTYLLLYPFLGQKTAEIFGKDLLEDDKLISLVRGLLRENDLVKPFECVATVAEIKEAIYLGRLRARKDGNTIPKVLQVIPPPKTLILGFSREGKATLNYLKKHFPDMEVDVADQTDGENYLEELKSHDVIVKSPGIPFLSEIKEAQKEGKIITSATKIFFDNFKGTIIGVTGTKGKSTTSSLIYEVLKAGGIDVHLIGNIGKPALEYLDELKKDSVVVYEMSSFMLEDLNQSPHIAVMTNLYPEHLDHHGDFKSYIKSKANITKYQTEKDYLIYNEDNLEVALVAKESKAQKIPYGKQEVSKKSNLLGKHNLLNTIPATLIGGLFNIPEEKIAQAITNFKPLPHRLEYVGEFNGIKFYNDSLSTIPQATIAAIDALGDDVETLIAGGFDRGVDYGVLGEAIAKSRIKTLILFPDTGEKIWEAIKKVQSSKFKVQSFNTESMKEAAKLAFKHTSPGKIALLSPASSSFNLFKDYADRGDQFKEAITHYSPAV